MRLTLVTPDWEAGWTATLEADYPPGSVKDRMGGSMIAAAEG